MQISSSAVRRLTTAELLTIIELFRNQAGNFGDLYAHALDELEKRMTYRFEERHGWKHNSDMPGTLIISYDDDGEPKITTEQGEQIKGVIAIRVSSHAEHQNTVFLKAVVKMKP